jgi:hypothetical protein
MMELKDQKTTTIHSSSKHFIDGYLEPSLGEVAATVMGGPIVFKTSKSLC